MKGQAKSAAYLTSTCSLQIFFLLLQLPTALSDTELDNRGPKTEGHQGTKDRGTWSQRTEAEGQQGTKDKGQQGTKDRE